MAKKKSEIPKSTPVSGDAAAPAAVHSPYLVLARKYRPQSFEDLIGQEAMTRTLRNAFAYSINTVAAKMGQEVGFSTVASMARRFGMS